MRQALSGGRLWQKQLIKIHLREAGRNIARENVINQPKKKEKT